QTGTCEASPLLRCHLDLNFVGNRLCYLGLQQQDVGELALVLPGPEMPIRRSMHQLSSDANATARSRDCTLDHRVDVQLTSDIRQRLGRPFVTHDRSAWRDAKRADLRQPREQRVGHAVDKKILGGSAEELVQRKT